MICNLRWWVESLNGWIFYLAVISIIRYRYLFWHWCLVKKSGYAGHPVNKFQLYSRKTRYAHWKLKITFLSRWRLATAVLKRWPSRSPWRWRMPQSELHIPLEYGSNIYLVITLFIRSFFTLSSAFIVMDLLFSEFLNDEIITDFFILICCICYVSFVNQLFDILARKIFFSQFSHSCKLLFCSSVKAFVH